ncbi:MAG: Kelch repeat-containing protein, partial [Actinomycetota bacterium]
IELSAGGTEVVTANFTVDNGSTPPPPPPPSTRSLLVSTSPDRSSPVALQGRTVAGGIYVFVSPETGIVRVRFFVDDPAMSGTPYKTEGNAPYDLAGTASNGTALAYNTTQLLDGPHSVTASIELSAGGTEVVTANFTVSNLGPALAFTPGTLSFSVEPEGTAAQTLTIDTNDGGAAPFGVSDDAPWLSVSPTSGTTPATLTASVDATGLASGTYSATITGTAGGYANAVASVSLAVGDTHGCSPLACEEILVPVPYELDFSSNHGKILDGSGTGTGYTYIQPTTNGTGYIPANVSMDTGVGQLNIRTTSGLLSEATNSQDNALGVGIDAASQALLIATTLVDPPVGTGNSEQAGLWFGTDEDNYVKLVVLSQSAGTKIQHFLEVNGSRAAKQLSGSLSLTGAQVRLELRLSPVDRTVTGSYEIGDGVSGNLGTFKIPPEFFSFDAAGIDPRIGTRSFGGIFASHRNGSSSLTYVFDEFVVKPVGAAGPSQAGIAFDRSFFSVTMPTSMVWGPDERLYVTEAFGKIHAFTLDANKQPIADQVITTLGTRLTLGITVDPLSTPANVILWVSHSSPSFNDGEPNSSTVTRLSGPSFTDRVEVITGLPRAKANHAINSIHFGADGRLYIAQGGNTGAGAPNEANTEFGTMQEQPLSAALLVADVRDPTFDGSCNNPADIFGPPPCDVVPYGTGLRNAYDFVFHSNGSLYAPDNGLGVTGTYPPSPTPPCLGFGDPTPWTQGGDNPGEQPDILVRIEQGKYYGHPNPYRNECVFKNGSFQGVPPLPNYQPPIFALGDHRSANGTIEYMANAFCGSLKNELLVANFSVGDDITRIRLSPDGMSVQSSGSLAGGFNDPLPLAQDPSGTVYVGEFGGNKVTALIPKNLGCWSTKQPLPVQLLDAGGTALDGKSYVVGGKTSSGPQSTMHIYDPASDTWATGPDLPGPAVENPAVVAWDGKLYAFGGSTAPFSGAVSSAAVYDPAQNAWTSLTPMPTARSGAAAQAIGGLIYVAGGMGADGASLNTFEVYDPQTDSWITAAPMTTRRDNPGSAVLNGMLYIFGGRTRNADGSTVDAALTSVEMYNPTTNTWSARAPMPSGRRTMVVGTIGGRAQVMGGEVPGGAGVSSANEEYDPVTDTWTVLTPMKTPRHGAVAGTIAGIVYVVGGGSTGGGSFTDVNEAFAF